MRKWAAHLVALKGDEDGQSLVFGAMTIFIVMFFAAMILSVGQVTSRRIQMQFAADSAAYSTALVESQNLNAIALLNTSMAEVRTRALRYAADVNAYGVLAEIRDRVLYPGIHMRDALEQEINSLRQQMQNSQDPDERQGLQRAIDRLSAMLTNYGSTPDDVGELSRSGTDPQNIQRVVGINRADLKYVDAYETAEKWLPAANEWLREMSRLEHTLAILAPRLAAQTAYETARQNGAEYASVFPASRWLPREDAYLMLDVFQRGPQWWRVQGPNTILEVKKDGCGACIGCNDCGECEECWTVYWMKGPARQGMYRICKLKDKRWFIENVSQRGGTLDEVCIQQKDDMYVVTYGPEGVRLKYHRDHSPPWLEVTNSNGEWPHNTFFVRQVQGVVEYARYRWDDNLDRWVMPTEADFRPLSLTAVSVDGVKVNVNLDPTIRLGSARLHVTVPASIQLPWATIRLTDPIAVTTTINSINVWIKEEQFGIGRRGHIIRMNQADGRWRTFFDRRSEYWWQHRLTGVGEAHWEYEYMEFGAKLEPERNMERLLAHRDFELGGGILPTSEPGPGMPYWAYDSERNPQGWMDPRTGQLVTDEGDYKYYQVRDCWDPLDTGVPPGNQPPPGEPDGMWEIEVDLNNNGTIDAGEVFERPCPTCRQTGRVVIEPDDVFGRSGQWVRTSDYPHRNNASADDYQQANVWKTEEEKLEFNEKFNDFVPLVLTEDFHKFGVSVGVWHRRESHFASAEEGGHLERPMQYMLHDPRAGMKGIMRESEGPRQQAEILRPSWGYFAVSAARSRLNPQSADGAGYPLEHGVYIDHPELREAWLDHSQLNLYARSYSRRPVYWDARLVPLSRQVLDEDVELGLRTMVESGTGWLMTRLARGAPWGWTDEFDRYEVPEVANRLTSDVRPRRPYPRLGGPYEDESGILRDPLVEHLADQGPGRYPRGGQLDYHRLDDEVVTH